MVDLESFLVPLMVWLLVYLFKYIKAKCHRDSRMVEFAKTLPGPRGLPIIGNSMDFYQKGDTLKKMLEYNEKYGHIFRLWIGKYLAIGLSNIEDLENVFRNSKMLAKPKIFKSFEDAFGDGLFSTQSISQWKKTRKLFQPLYNRNVLHVYTSTMNDRITNLVKKMKDLENGAEFDAWNYMQSLSLDIILKSTMNVDLNGDDKMALQYHAAVTKAATICFRKIYFPWLQYKLIDCLFYKKQTQKFRNEAGEFLLKLIEEKKDEIVHQIEAHKNETTSSKDIAPKTFLTLSYELAEWEKNEKIMIDTLLDILIAGTDPTSVMNSLFLLVVAIHQDIQDKLYDELYEIFGSSDRLADENDLARLTYFNKVLKETFRRFPLFPLIFREAEEDSKLGNRLIPAGTIIIISVAAVHFNPEYYPNPWKFNPENFSPEAMEKRPKLAFLSFSAGIRNCLGSHFAMLEMKLALSTLLRNFSFHTKMKMKDIYMGNNFSMTSVNGYKLTIKSRIRKPTYL